MNQYKKIKLSILSAIIILFNGISASDPQNHSLNLFKKAALCAVGIGASAYILHNKLHTKAAHGLFKVVNTHPGASIFVVGTSLQLALFKMQKDMINAHNKGNTEISRFTMTKPEDIQTRFTDVAGAAESKEDLEEIIDFLKNPEKYKQIGAKIPKGILLTGEPGNGKTLLAKAVAGEANCPFFSASGSEFVETYVGVGAARVRELFAQARKHAPCIIFIDEIDSVGGKRNSSPSRSEERDVTLNQLLIEMDGFAEAQAPIVIIGATNRSDILDKALLRPGRFDRKIHVDYPDMESRLEILKIHSRNISLNDKVNLLTVARGTPGFSGADLANLVNEAALHAVQIGKSEVDMTDFNEAMDKMMLGKERKGMIRSKEELRMTAYHESGHALITLLMPEHSDPLHKITILPRGQALGVAFTYPLKDKYSYYKEEFEAMVMRCLGGRAAEELVFNKLATGASNDFEKATSIVRNMICKFGMSPKLGLVSYDKNNYSGATAQLIDEEVRNLMDHYYKKTIKLLRDNRDKLNLLAETLLEKETLFAEEIYELLNIAPRETNSLVTKK